MDKINFNNVFSASVYEAYIKLYEKMNEIIEQSNELVTDTDNKIEIMKQILDDGIEGIKPEINNQLYELINNGTIEEIINTNIFNDLNSQIKDIMQKKIYQFSDIATMKKCNLKVGEVCETLGYYTVNDLGGSKYYIIDDDSLIEDGGNIHNLDNGLKAKLIVENNCVNIKQFGAIGDGVSDDSNSINTALKTFNNVYIPSGRYFIDETIKMRIDTTLKGDSSKNTVFLVGSSLTDKNVIEYGSSYVYNSVNGKISNIRLQTKEANQNRGLGIYLYSSLRIEDVCFYQLKCSIKKHTNYIDNIKILDCMFAYCSGTSNRYVVELTGSCDAVELRNIHFVDSYTDATTGGTKFTRYRGIKISNCRGGLIDNCIINGQLEIDDCKAFKISSLHIEGSQHENYKGNLSWVNISRSKVKMENIYMHKRVDGANIKLQTLSTNDSNESNDVIIENLSISYPKELMSLMKCYDDSNSFDIDKDKLSTLKLKNCFVYFDFSNSWTTTNSTVGVRIKGIDDFNKHSSYYSNNCEISSYNNVLTDIPVCKVNSIYKNDYIFIYSSSNNNIPWFESNCNETKQFVTGVYCFDYERRLALLKNTTELQLPTTTTINGVGGKGILIRNSYSAVLDGIGFELIVYRGNSSNSYDKITRVPCCTSYYLYDCGTNIMGVPTKTRTPSPIDDFNYVYKFRTINGGDNVEFYAPTPPVYGTFKRFDRCINTNISDSQPKKWIYDGSTWVALN